MDKISTILSKKESVLIEKLIAKYGLFVDSGQIYEQLKAEMTAQEIKNAVGRLVKRGWLIRLKRGTYYITTLESRGVANVSAYVIAQSLADDAYVSFETALQYHGIFDQLLTTVTSLSLSKHSIRELQGTKYEFVKISKANFYGWEEIQMEGKAVKVATLEKAVLDMIGIRKTAYSMDLVLEKLKDYKDNFDFEKLFEFSKKQTLTLKRILGFLLDRAGIDSEKIYMQTKDSKGSSYMTADSKKLYDAKWRLYYHNIFE
ncbi:MAG: type IV toxin-antitoxin system AbiEi family antitoxin [bacterium]